MRAAWVVAGAFLCAMPAAARASEELVPKIEVGGRIFARLESSSVDQWRRDLSLPSARLSLQARWKGLLKAVVEADLASPELLKDAFAEVKLGGGASVRAGRFKAPFSARELTSRWRLELVHRGLVNDAVTTADWAGRMEGLQLRWVPRFYRRLELAAAGFAGGARGETLAGRVAWHPIDELSFGAGALTHALGEGGTAWGADAALRLFGAVLAVEGTLLPAPIAAAPGRRKGLTALLARRFELGAAGLWLEPLAGAEWLWPVSGAPLHALTAGVNLGHADHLRLQVQYVRGRLEAAEPAGDRVVAQLGARF